MDGQYTTANAGGGASVGMSAPIASLIGVIGSGYASYKGAQAKKTLTEANRIVAESNAQMADANAADAALVAQINYGNNALRANRTLNRADRERGATQAALAGRGIDIRSGSALDALMGVSAVGAIEAGMQEQQARNQQGADRSKAAAFRNQGARFRNQANAYGAEADAYSPFAAGSASLLGNAGKVHDSWTTYSKGMKSAQQMASDAENAQAVRDYAPRLD